MKVGTYNVNSIRTRKGLIMSWLEHRKDDIDILCLQEIKVEEELFPFEDFEKRGFHCAVSGQKGYNGVAVCAKVPLTDRGAGFGEANWDQQRRLIQGRWKEVRILNVYAPHGGERSTEKFQYKLKWYKKFLSHLKKHYSPDEKILMVGDFNVAREDRDVYDPQVLQDTIGTMKEEREAFRELLNWGLIDTFRALYPDRKQFTWWDYMGGAIWRDEGMRIDYILCTRPLFSQLKNLEVDLWPRRRRVPKPSDHAPLIGLFGEK